MGVPVYDDHRLFEMLVLESFQAGLTWECVLNKREDFRRAFDEFELEKVCAYGEEEIERLKNDPKIIRNRLKIQAWWRMHRSSARLSRSSAVFRIISGTGPTERLYTRMTGLLQSFLMQCQKI